MIHRDLKPENIFLVNSDEMDIDNKQALLWVKIGDFGISKGGISEKTNELKTEEKKLIQLKIISDEDV